MATINNPEEMNSPIELFVSAGSNPDTPTSEKYEFKGQEFYNDGTGVLLVSGRVLGGHTIKALVTSKEKADVSLGFYSVNGKTRTVDFGQRIYDDVTF